MPEFPITAVARASGLTSRTLRYYEQIGLLRPSRVADTGYRFYGDAELSRLYRVLSLRALGLSLAAIQTALDDETSLVEAITIHLSLLEERRDRIDHQIVAVRHTLDAVTKGQTMSIEDLFAGVDHGQYEAEVRERWGDQAWERSAQRRDAMSDEQRQSDDKRSLDINAALRDAATAAQDPASPTFQALIAAHHGWVTDQWAGRAPDRAAYTGLAELYVADERFAATYGGRGTAAIIRDAMHLWSEANLR